MTHVSRNTGNNEWFTPSLLVEAARRVMGGIDLDPASSTMANEVVGASRFYTEADNGLTQPWYGRVWLNPPYAQPLVSMFARRLAGAVFRGDVEQACVLVNNATETNHFQWLAEMASAFCFPKRRVRFWHPDRPSSAPLQGQAILYFGPEVEAFRREFKDVGGTARTLRDGATRNRLCRACGVTFTPPRTDARYCSSPCRQRAYRGRNQHGVRLGGIGPAMTSGVSNNTESVSALGNERQTITDHR